MSSHSKIQSRPRIEPMQQLREDDESKLQAIAQSVGYRPNALATMAHRPGFPSLVIDVITCILKQPGYLPETLRYLLACAAGRHGGSFYTATHLVHAAHQAGATWTQIEALGTDTADHTFSVQELAIFGLAAPFANAQQKEIAWEMAKTHWLEPALAEAGTVIAVIAMFTRWNLLMETVIEDEPASVLAHVQWLKQMATR